MHNPSSPMHTLTQTHPTSTSGRVVQQPGTD